jgi:hypothetical protein
MWKLENNIFKETNFPFFHMMTTRALGNMKGEVLREKFCINNKIDPSNLITLGQSHSNNVAIAGCEDRGREIPSCDGLVTNVSKLPLAVFTADCLPVFIAHKEKNIVAIIHAGWQGIVKNIVPAALKMIKNKFKISPSSLFVAIGPHIQEDCFEIGDDLREIFNVGGTVTNISLSSIVLKQLSEEGVENVSVSSSCTCHESELFYSFRADQTPCRMMSLVMLK